MHIFSSDIVSSNLIYDGPTSSGIILDLGEMVKCGINFPSTDMANPQLMETAVYTWGKGEPSLKLDEHTCVLLKYVDIYVGFPVHSHHLIIPCHKIHIFKA